MCCTSVFSRLTIANLSNFDVSSTVRPSLFMENINLEESRIVFTQSAVSNETHTEIDVLLFFFCNLTSVVCCTGLIKLV